MPYDEKNQLPIAANLERSLAMRLSNRRKTGPILGLSMTSMIDVVFLLLIFFLVTSTFVSPERQIESAIQVDEQGKSASAIGLEPAIIRISQLGNQTVFQLGAIKTSDLSDIKPVLRQFEDKSEGAFVRAGDGVPFEAAAQAIAACKSNGFAVVSYLPTD